MIALYSLFQRQCLREIRLQGRQWRFVIQACLFFLMILFFFPLTLPPEKSLLRMVTPGLVWIALLLALFLSAEHLFQQDGDDGVIEQWLVSGYPLSVFVSAKIGVHWILNVLPMLLLCPILAIILSLDVADTIILMLSLLVGTPAILFFCALASVFGMGVQQKGVLMLLILLPLTLPVMIFGSAVLTAALAGFPVSGHLAILLAMSLVAVVLLPFAVAAVIRVGYQ